jgi:putative membrane protein
MPEKPLGQLCAGKPERFRRPMLFLIVSFILCIPLVLFALSNTEIVRLGFWPTDYGVDVHVSLAILVAMAIAFLVGALVVWISELGQRRRARQAERTVRLLEAQIEELKARTGPTMSLPQGS